MFDSSFHLEHFSTKELIEEVKKRFDRGEVDPVEIDCLTVNTGGNFYIIIDDEGSFMKSGSGPAFILVTNDP